MAEAQLHDIADTLMGNGAVWNDGSGDAFCVRVDPAKTLQVLRSYGVDGISIPSPASTTALASPADLELDWLVLYKRVVETVNLSLYRRYDDDMGAAMGAIRGTAHHYWLSERRASGSLSRVHPINHTYFSRLETHAVANNGFIWGGDPEVDFTAPVDTGRPAPVPLSSPSPQAAQRGGSPTARDDGAGGAPPICTASTPYMRRDLVIWGDCVKLNYGRRDADSPWLWAHMTAYVETMASIFHGFRIDNAHGTPIHVAAAMIDAGRRVRPNLYVCGELFTGSESKDVHYVQTLGLNGLIREAMQADGPHELSRNIHMHGGKPVASISSRDVLGFDPETSTVELLPSALPAIFFDCTHDNETPAQKRHAADALSSAALVSAAVSATGTVRGFDILVPRNLSVVSERRPYVLVPRSGGDGGGDGGGGGGRGGGRGGSGGGSVVSNAFIVPSPKANPKGLLDAGILRARAVLNRLHTQLAAEGFSELHVHHDGLAGGDVIVVQRAHPTRPESYVYIVRTAFDNASRPSTPVSSAAESARLKDAAASASSDPNCLHTVRLEGRVERVELAALLVVDMSSKPRPDVISGFGSRLEYADATTTTTTAGDAGGAGKPNLEPLGFAKLRTDASLTYVDLQTRRFLPGSVLVYKLHNPQYCIPATAAAAKASPSSSQFPVPPLSDLTAALANPDLSLVDFSRLLFRCDAEERDDSFGVRGTYGLPDIGLLSWAGFAGLEPLLRHIRMHNDMGHPLCQNLRDGNWLLDYLVDRLGGYPALGPIKDWVGAHFDVVKRLSPGHRPRAFNLVVSAVYSSAVAAVSSRMSTFVSSVGGSESSVSRLATDLALTSVALFTDTRSAPLLHPPLLSREDDARFLRSAGPSLAAGTPHFSTGFMRNWGRDTFIALRGLLLVPGRFQDAKDTILAYATVVRHGLIPNLMDGGRNPRYNARDATWWFLQAVQDYCRMAPDGPSILSAYVYKAFPSDCQDDYHDVDREGGLGGSHSQYVATARVVLGNRAARLKTGQTPADITDADLVPTLAEVVLEILETHANGIDFVEWNAGHSLDCHMKHEGFRVTVTRDPDTGLLLGGSSNNCGTWMDKMGESPEHGTDGVPATPRDGAPVEITGLLYSTLAWVADLQADPSSGVANRALKLTGGGGGGSLTVKAWADQLKAGFENQYWVPEHAAQDTAYAVNPALINQRGIYKDTVGASAEWADYQFRPNQVVALTVAPGLFDPDHAVAALGNVEAKLLGKPQLGIKTLSPDDWAYRGDYDNSSTAEASVAKGFNYHQGPEWLWPVGYYLRARIQFPPPAAVAQPSTKKNNKKNKHKKKTFGLTSDAALRMVLAHTAPHARHLRTSMDGGLPELTNSNGQHCRDSCSTQAWSSSTLLDALYDAATL